VPTSDVAKDFFSAISTLPSATLEQIYFAIGAELQDREVTAMESFMLKLDREVTAMERETEREVA
jgi:hypothetical protein